MSTDRSLKLRLPRLRFAPTPLAPIEQVRREVPDRSHERGPSDEEDAEPVYAAMLPADPRGLGGEAGRLIVTLFTGDRKRLLLDLLRQLAAPEGLRARWQVKAFTVEASLSASLAGVGAVAVVVQPVVGRGRAALSDVELDRLADDLERQLRPDGPLRAPDASTSGEAEPPLRVRPIAPGDDVGLYAGRQFREMRFGIGRSGGAGDRAARQAARVIDRFSNVLGDQQVPLAYLHYPLRWAGATDGRLQWLRMAYAVTDDPAVDVAVEMAAYAIADDEDVVLSTYDPARRGALEDRFVRLRTPRGRRRHLLEDSTPGVEHEADAEAEAEAGAGSRPTMALCIRGRARAGLVGRLLGGMSEASVYGCTMAVLYGNTVCNVVVDRAAGEHLRDRLAELAPDVTVVSYPVGARTQIVGGAGHDEVSCWVAWSCGDSIGVMHRVIDAVDTVFRGRRVDIPNVNYAISRVLADGATCAGKIQFVCSRAEAQQVGLVPAARDVVDRGSADLPGWSALEAEVRAALQPGLVGWRPPHVEWLDRPVAVGPVEPSEEPWARLVVPEGAVAEVHDVAIERRYWVNDIDDLGTGHRRRRRPSSVVPDVVAGARAVTRRVRPRRVTA